MDGVLLGVDGRLSERIKDQPTGWSWYVLSQLDGAGRTGADWQSALTALNGKEAVVVYQVGSADPSQLDRVRNALSGARFIAVSDRREGADLQDLINGRLIDRFYVTPDQDEAILAAVTETFPSTVEKTPTILAGMEDTVEESVVTSFYIYDLIYGDLDKARRMGDLRKQFGPLAYPNCALTILVDNFWELCRDLDNKSRYGIKMEYLKLLRAYIRTSELESIACSLIGTDKLIALVHVPEGPEQEGPRKVLEMAADLKEYINKRAQRTVSIGVGNVYRDSRWIWKSYEESFNALEYTFYLGNDSVIHYEETKNFTTLRNSEDQLPACKYNFFRHINQWSEAEIAADYEDTLEGLFSRSFSSETIKSIVIKYNFEILDHLEQMDLPVAELHDHLIQSSTGILRASTLEGIRRINRDYIQRVARAIVSKRQSNDVGAAIDSARAFLEKYYYRDLSLELMAQVSNLSPAYFSRKFKEHIGLNYSDYLEQIRLEQARELLLTSPISLGEIARRVGFHDYSYFSSRFKRKYGSGPTHYKNEQSATAY